jgi:glutathionylspermidine synthase
MLAALASPETASRWSGVLALTRRPSPVLPPSAYPRTTADHPFMIEREWTHDARWDMSAADLARFGVVAERLFGLASRLALATLDDDARLDRLAIGPERDTMRRSVSRGETPIVARMDFALAEAPGGYLPVLLEINGDTAGNYLEGGLIQREWGRATGNATAGDAMELALATALRRLPGPLCILHHPGDPYIVEHAKYLASLVPGAFRVEYPDVPSPSAGAVYKMFRWGRLWAGRFPEVAAWAARREEQVYEPAWAALLQHKGLLPELWRTAEGDPHLLPATLDGPEALPDGGRAGWAEKSFHGISGYEVEIHGPGTPVRTARPGFVYQTRVPPLRVDGLYPILCATIVDGRFAGAVMREDDTAISTDDIVTPIAIGAGAIGAGAIGATA